MLFHRIAEDRIKGTDRLGLEVFTSMCGHEALPNLIVASTGWEDLDEESRGIAREQELQKEFLTEAIANGGRYTRFESPTESQGQSKSVRGRAPVAESTETIPVHIVATAFAASLQVYMSARSLEA